ncbi:MAG: GAF domain-containing sensor histidine kinase [Nocardioides sp.]|nr:GAF domain-containing sensor histidine kinase [Nocardioides sp.]
MSIADRRTPEPGDGLSWVDTSTQLVLDLIAQGVTELAGFEVAAISVARGHDLEVVAVSGNESARAQLEGSRTPLAMTVELIELAESWGTLKFVPHEMSVPHLSNNDWVPDFTPLAGPDAWYPEDMLFAPILDTSGQLRGIVAVDLPRDGRRPGPEQRRTLERYALQAGRAVLTALDRERLADQMAMATHARNVVRKASRELSLDRLLVECQSELVAGFRAMGMWIHTLDDDTAAGAGSMFSERDVEITLPPQLVSLSNLNARRAWAERRADVISAHQVQGRDLTTAEAEAVLDFLATLGIASILFVPLGQGSRCLGAMVLTRGFEDPEWTEAETSVALDVGSDLGHAISHAQAFAREQQLVRELQEVDSYKSELVATLSHELKTPLTSILGNLELLEDMTDLPEDGQRSLAAIDRSAHRIMRVVDDLMLLAKVEDPVQGMNVRPVDIGAIVDDVVELNDVGVHRRRLAISVRRPAHPVLAAGDADDIDRVIANIISNATKYTKDGGRIVITVEQIGAEVVFTCSDNGIGIAEGDLPLLFREFFRSTNPSALSVPGTGLGLAIVERIVTRHGGRVDVTSRRGVGSTFRVVLPAANPGPRQGPGALVQPVAEHSA